MALRSQQPKSRDEVEHLVAVYGYVVPDEEDVSDYLLKNAAIVPVLHEAATEFPRYFPPEAHRTLRVFHDPEWGDIGPLFVTLEWPHESSFDAQARLTSFQDEWWFPRAIETRTGSAIVFDVA